MGKPVIFAVDWICKPDKVEELKKIAEKLAPACRQEPGNIQFDIHQDSRDPTHFFLFEIWKDADAVKQHAETEHFKTLAAGEATKCLQDRKLRKMIPLAPRL
ncbi:hypothetical protein BZG36_01207 [Bifiguratus adelaidae]|uniref:ABM domain-containing protein n=1 Tax=Bifiguratus adelaidae TaxID=1938954 RepID=A0A261Y5N2_9FUNG|nr:hypothetical protein BZG36_01207 [Bifiguratus adelaidae]